MLICAALLVQVEGLDHTTIVPCRRHGDGFKILEDLGSAPKTKYTVLSQGFIDHAGRFLNRIDAWKHAAECHQLSTTTQWYKDDHADCELYSEDLY
jgi:hypothetical protein